MKSEYLKVLVASTALALGTGTQAFAASEGSEYITSFTLRVGASIDAQTLDEAEEIANNYLDNLSAVNEVTQESVLNSLSTVINTKEGYYTVSISNWNKRDATETSRGYLSFDVLIKDTNGVTKTCPYNLKYIAALAQSPDTIKSMYIERLASYLPDNTTTEDDLKGLVNITNDDIHVGVSEFKLEPATSISQGHITGFINVYDSTVASSDPTPVPIDLVIQPNRYELSTANNRVRNFLNSYHWQNNTDFGQLLIELTELLDGQNISVSYGFGEDAPSITPATSSELGRVNGKIILTGRNNAGETTSVSIDLNQSIARLPRDLNLVYNTITERYRDYIATNVTTADSLVVFAMNYVDSENIEIEVQDFERNNATEALAGNISGTMVVRDTITHEEKYIDLRKTISKLPQTSMGIIGLLTNSQSVLTLTNTTTEEQLRETLQILVSGASGSSMTLSTNDFSLNPADTDSPGNVHVKVTVTDADNNVSATDLTFPINRLNKNSSQAADTIRDKISESGEDDLRDITDLTYFEDYLKRLLGLASGDVSIDTSHIEMRPATRTEAGYVKGYVLITDRLGSTTKLPVDMILPATGTSEEVNDALKNEITNIITGGDTGDTNITNITNATDLKKLLEELRNKYPGYVIDTSNVKEDPATPEKEGSLKGYITITGPDGVPIQIPVEKVIEKTAVTESYINDKLVTTNSFTSLDALKEWINSRLSTLLPNSTLDLSQIKLVGNKWTGQIIITDKDGKVYKPTINVTKDLSQASSGGSSSSGSHHSHSNDSNDNTTDSNQTTNSESGNNTHGTTSTDSPLSHLFKEATSLNYVTDTSAEGKALGVNSSGQVNLIKVDSVQGNKCVVTSPDDGKLVVSRVYEYTPEINKYIYKRDVSINYLDEATIEFNTIAGKSYILAQEEIDSNVVANQGWATGKDTPAGVSWYYVNGTNLQKGWIFDGTGWYHLNDSNSEMDTGWKNINNEWYYLNQVSDGTKGKMQTGWIYSSGEWYFLDSGSGKMKTGWVQTNGNWYYLNTYSGKMLRNTTQVINGVSYSFDASGRLK